MFNKKESPFTTFKKWLLNYNNIDYEIINKNINPYIILPMFIFTNMKYIDLVIYINDNFNNFNRLKQITKYKNDFFHFLKTIVLRFKIDWNDFSFYKINNESKNNNNKLIELYPFLKKYEIEQLNQHINKFDDDFSELKENVIKIKKKRKNAK